MPGTVLGARDTVVDSREIPSYLELLFSERFSVRVYYRNKLQ